jgi:SPP1 family predicted phage head-tail adaptor
MRIEVPSDLPDGAGGATRAFTEVQLVWAAVEPLKADDRLNDASIEQAVTHRILMRAGPTLTTAHRLRLGSRLFAIKGVRPADRLEDHMIILAEEVRP